MTSKYEGFWIDTACTTMQHEAGDVDESGKIWTMTGGFADPQSGKTLQKRSVITLQDSDHHLMETYMTTPEGDESKIMEISYERA